MRATELVENPYAPPMSVDLADPTEGLRRATVRMYRGMAYAGIAFILLGAVEIAMIFLTERPREAGWMIGILLEFGLFIAFFTFMLKTATRLAADLDGTYRRARWIAILAASIFFPILTIPGILAVRRLERYRTHLLGWTEDRS